MRLLWPLLGLFLCACPGDPQGTEIEIVTGYQPAVIGNTIYIPREIDIKEPPAVYEPQFAEAGVAFQMWAGLVAPNGELTPSGFPEKHFKLRVQINLWPMQEVIEECQRSSGNPQAWACSIKGEPCRIWVAPDHPPGVWAHEMWHCRFGSFH